MIEEEDSAQTDEDLTTSNIPSIETINAPEGPPAKDAPPKKVQLTKNLSVEEPHIARLTKPLLTKKTSLFNELTNAR